MKIPKTISYPLFMIAGLFVVVIFVTADTYEQVAVASVLYIPLAYLALRILPQERWTRSVKVEVANPQTTPVAGVITQTTTPTESNIDIEKRTFLKLIGAAGFSFLLFSFINRGAGNILPGKSIGNGRSKLEDKEGNTVDPAERQPLDGYKISEIDENETTYLTYYGFTNKDGAWLIMKEDEDNGSYRYVSGNADFPTSWQNRDKLSYDYFYNVF